MLEETVKNEKSPPAETALTMLSFIQSDLPSGGTAAEQRFFNLFGPLCERIFGVMSKEDGYRHKDGGWLAAQNAWPRPAAAIMLSTRSSSSSSSSSPSPRKTANAIGQQISKVRATTSASSAIEQDPVFRLLATAGSPIPGREETNLPTLIEAISRETEKRPTVSFPFPFHALPRSLQDAWLTLVEASMLSSGGMMMGAGISSHHIMNVSSASAVAVSGALVTESEHRLLTQLMRKRPEEQQQLKYYLQQRSAQQQQDQPHQHLQQPLHLSPRMGLRSSPGSTNTTLSPKQSISSSTMTSSHGKEGEIPAPAVLLSMLEYYLVLFLRFPLAMPDRSKSPAGVANIKGVNVHRIPRPSPSLHSSSSESYGETLYFEIFARMVRHFLPLEAPEENRYMDFSSSSASGSNFAESELFVRLIMALWLEPLRITPTVQVVQMIHERRGRTMVEPLLLDLDASCILTVFSTLQQQPQQPPPQEPKFPTPLVQRCVRKLILAALLDPGVRIQCRSTAVAPQLTACLRTLQPAVYNYIRTGLRFASIHSSESSFFGAFNAWLIWMEPWNVTPSRRLASQFGMAMPTFSEPSKYDSSWEPYIAANLFMYCVPLAIFVRRARELDFSSNKFQRSIEIVKRVFRVFKPDVVEAISKYLDDINNNNFDIGNNNCALLRTHLEALGPFVPPVGQRLSLSSLKNDMQSLLEEIDSQHMKKVRELGSLDRMIGRLEGFFGKGVVSGEEKTLVSLIERAKVIARLPIDYDILPSSSRTGGNGSLPELSNEQPRLRDENGELSEYAREQLLQGRIKCDPAEVPYRGDPMRGRARTYEIPVMVTLTILASDWMNERFGLSATSRFRFNLRFLADYRNINFCVFAALAFYVLSKIVF